MISKSIKDICPDFVHIENYDEAIADTENMWECHHKLEAWYSSKELIEMDRYFNVPARELVFCKSKAEHYKWPHKAREDFFKTLKGKVPWNKGVTGLESAFKGKHHTEEAKEKMRTAKQKYFENGGVSNMKGRHHTEETKRKISESVKKSGGKRGPAFKIYWVEGNKVFSSMRECARFFDVTKGYISQVLNGKKETVRGYHIRRV